MNTSKSFVSVLPIPTSFSVVLNKRFLTVILFGTIFSLFVLSILQVNAYTKEMYLIKDYQRSIAQLTQENGSLEINFSKANSLNNIGNYIGTESFEKAQTISYIKVLGETALAK